MITPSEILQDIVDYLNELTLSESFTAVRKYKPVDELISMGSEVFVNVTTGGMDRDREDRGRKRITTRVKVTVSKKTDAALLDISGMLRICEEIAEAFTDKDFYTFRIIDLPLINPVYDSFKFYKTAIFQSIIILEAAVESDRFILADPELLCLTDSEGHLLCH